MTNQHVLGYRNNTVISFIISFSVNKMPFCQLDDRKGKKSVKGTFTIFIYSFRDCKLFLLTGIHINSVVILLMYCNVNFTPQI